MRAAFSMSTCRRGTLQLAYMPTTATGTISTVGYACFSHSIQRTSSKAVRGSNQFRRTDHGACVFCQAEFTRLVDWKRRKVTEWLPERPA